MIIQSLTRSFKLELLQGVHDFTNDTFNIALYDASATLTAATEAYVATGEITAAGYDAGGTIITATTPASYGNYAVVSFNPAIWTSDNITARGALIYNVTKDSRSVAVLNFGSDRSSVSGLFSVSFRSGSAGLIKIN